jgi:quinol monooxygenase YgiN
MTAAADKGTALADALTKIAAIAEKLPGCEGVQILRDIESPQNFVLIEKWISVEAHKAGLSSFPKEALAPLSTALAAPPEGAYFDHVV